ncbi:unnamed protein product [Closterium sp. NIES-65]|nr:unnamed protein product [Closterium sp. NIES-65]
MHPPHLHLSPSQVSHYRPSILYSQKPLPRDQEPQPPPVIPRQIHPHTDTRPQTHLSSHDVAPPQLAPPAASRATDATPPPALPPPSAPSTAVGSAANSPFSLCPPSTPPCLTPSCLSPSCK